MTRASQFATGLLSLLAVWLVASRNATLFPEGLQSFIAYFPIWAMFGFGLVSASNILFHLVTFRECPEAAKELGKQLREAKADLAKKGIIVN